MSRLLKEALLAPVVATLLTIPSFSALADLNVPGLACQAPYLDQAFPMRWHEHYIYNPEANQTTWVVCPVAFETLILTDPFRVGVFGVKTQGASGFPVCYMNVVSLSNQHLTGVMDNPGQRYIYTQQLTNFAPPGMPQAWVAFRIINQQDIRDIMDQGGGGGGPANWTITVNCRLPPGHAIGMISLY
jgi:hypothetical protein